MYTNSYVWYVIFVILLPIWLQTGGSLFNKINTENY